MAAAATVAAATTSSVDGAIAAADAAAVAPTCAACWVVATTSVFYDTGAECSTRGAVYPAAPAPAAISDANVCGRYATGRPGVSNTDAATETSVGGSWHSDIWSLCGRAAAAR